MEEKKVLMDFDPIKLSLGKQSLHTYQAIVISNYIMDRREDDSGSS